jgi:hypothetical protein
LGVDARRSAGVNIDQKRKKANAVPSRYRQKIATAGHRAPHCPRGTLRNQRIRLIRRQRSAGKPGKTHKLQAFVSKLAYTRSERSNI